MCRNSPKVRNFELGFGHPTTGKLCQPSNKWIPLSNQGSIGHRNERNGLHFSYAVPKPTPALRP